MCWLRLTLRHYTSFYTCYTRDYAMNKPSKPTPDFPLFPHASRQWAKKIGDRMHYYGPWSDPDAALARYQEETNSRSRIESPEKPAKPHPDFHATWIAHPLCSTR